MLKKLLLPLLLLFSATAFAQKINIFTTKILRYDNSSVKGIVYDVSPHGVVLLDTKAVSSMSAKKIREVYLTGGLPTFIVPFDEVKEMNIRRRRSPAKGFGIGYLLSFVTLETIMAADYLSSSKNHDCDGSPRKRRFGNALLGASCAAPPGILVMGTISVLGGALGSLAGSASIKTIVLNPVSQEADAREKLRKYALALQTQSPPSLH